MVHECVALDDKGEPTGAPMAIKRIRDDLREPEDVMEEIRHRFEREARLLDDVLHHENIVGVLHRNLSDDQPFFIMPLADCNVWSEIDAGIEIARFDSALMAHIEELNRDFSRAHVGAGRAVRTDAQTADPADPAMVGPNGHRIAYTEDGDKVELIPDEDESGRVWQLLLRRNDKQILDTITSFGTKSGGTDTRTGVGASRAARRS